MIDRSNITAASGARAIKPFTISIVTRAQLPVRIVFLAGLLLRKLRLFLITCVHHRIGKLPFRVLIDADVWKYAGITIIIGYLDIIYAFGNIADSESSVLGNGLILQFIVAPVLRFCRRNV
jgi:hypothetical protein